MPGHRDFGKSLPCPTCHDYLRHSRLNDEERKLTLAGIVGAGSAATLRTLGELILASPWGFSVVWGGTGTAKSHLLMALVGSLCRRGVQAVYYHAVDLQSGLYRDMSDDSNNLEHYRRVPVLAIDELDKFRFTDWSRSQLQGLLDHRYREAIARRQITLFSMNKDPAGMDDGKYWLPEDILSRFSDGRFNRCAPEGQLIPGVHHALGADMRPFMQR